MDIGDKIPHFTLKDFEGIDLDSDDLLGSPFILYFYPKDNTPNCTRQACDIRDQMDMFDDLETTVLGISPDNGPSHADFIRKNNLNFTLLCDPDMALAKKFGAVKETEVDGALKSSILRSTFIVDAEGVIRWCERPVDVDGHALRVLKALRKVVN